MNKHIIFTAQSKQDKQNYFIIIILRLPAEILTTYNGLKAAEQEETCGGKEEYKMKQSLRNQLNTLKSVLQLSCYGFNSSKNSVVFNILNFIIRSF